MLIQKEAWINLIAVPAHWVPLDAHTERTFAFDEARKEPARCNRASESFLLIVRTRHVFTISDPRPNVNRPSWTSDLDTDDE